MAAISKKIEKFQYLGNGLTDPHKIWHGVPLHPNSL